MAREYGRAGGCLPPPRAPCARVHMRLTAAPASPPATPGRVRAQKVQAITPKLRHKCKTPQVNISK